jgi:hypothetical protein
MLPQLGARSLAAKTMASIKVKRVTKASKGSKMMARPRLEITAEARPYKLANHDRTATNMVKLTAAMADEEALTLLAMTLPMSAVMSNVHKSAIARRAVVIKPDILVVDGQGLLIASGFWFLVSGGRIDGTRNKINDYLWLKGAESRWMRKAAVRQGLAGLAGWLSWLA